MAGFTGFTRVAGSTWFGKSVAVLMIVGSMSVVARGQLPRNAGAEKRGDSLTNAWDHFSVDVSIRRLRLDGDGRRSGPAEPDLTYRWERQQKGVGWSTTMTVLPGAAPVVESIDGPRALKPMDRAVARIEDDEDGTPLRFYDARGRKIDVPSFEDLRKRSAGEPSFARELEALGSIASASRPPSPGREWVDALVVPKARKDARKRSIEGKFGRARGEVRGLDQFLTAGPDGQQELLVERAFQVPVEINVMKDGTLVSHTRIAYEPGADDVLIRRSVRIEEMTPGGADGKPGRTVSEIQFTNLRLEKKGGSR
jgi:hypothetical protein